MKLPIRRPTAWVIPFLLGNLLMCVLLVASTWLSPTTFSDRSTAISTDLLHSLTTNRQTDQQPWGTLRVQDFPLASANDAQSAWEKFMGPPKWFFAGTTERQLLRYLLSLNLHFHERQIILNRKYWVATPAGCEISPPESVVYALDSFSRGRIYAALAANAANPTQREAIMLPFSNLADRLAAAGLSCRQIIHLRQLMYVRAGSLCLSDLGIAEKVLGKAAFSRLVEYLFASPACRVSLRISGKSDINALATYWGKGGREELIKPLLKSLAKVPGGAEIDVTELLPDFARLRLYRYPQDELAQPVANPKDCIYSAMNFFRATPDTNFFNTNYLQEVLGRDYEAVSDAPTFGDLIVMQQENREIIHMCIYIAANLVFTKNGASHTQPWTLMRIEDTARGYYGSKAPGPMQLLRLKQPDPPNAPTSG